jgi:hypothetical protein
MKQAQLFVVLLLLAIAVANAAGNDPPHNKRWWLSLSLDEKESYQLGYEDCYVDSLKLKSPPYLEERHSIDLITAAYRNGKARPTDTVSSVMKGVWAARAGKGDVFPSTKGAEVWTEPHGYLDGLFWKGSSDAEMLSFIEGEIDCFNGEVVSKTRFPLPAAEYVKWVSEAYGLDKSYSGPRLSEDAKIADVLLKKGTRNRRTAHDGGNHADGAGERK